MNLFKKLQKDFTTWRSSSSASSDKQKKRDDYTDALAYLADRKRQADYDEALRRINPSMTHPLQNINGGQGAAMSAVNQSWPHAGGVFPQSPGQGWLAPQAPLEPMKEARHPTRQFTVEKVDNGYVLRSGKYSKICKDMEELSQQFIATMVEQQLDK